MKNDIIHTCFSLFWLQILNLPASLQNKSTRIGPFPWKRSVLQNPDQERTNQSTGICLRLGLPYNKCRILHYIMQQGQDELIGHFGKYHNTLCLSPQILHKHCFQFLLGLTMVPRENKNNAYAKLGGTKKEYYGIFRTGLCRN